MLAITFKATKRFPTFIGVKPANAETKAWLFGYMRDYQCGKPERELWYINQGRCFVARSEAGFRKVAEEAGIRIK